MNYQMVLCPDVLSQSQSRRVFVKYNTTFGKELKYNAPISAAIAVLGALTVFFWVFITYPIVFFVVAVGAVIVGFVVFINEKRYEARQKAIGELRPEDKSRTY